MAGDDHKKDGGGRGSARGGRGGGRGGPGGGRGGPGGHRGAPGGGGRSFTPRGEFSSPDVSQVNPAPGKDQVE